MARFPSVPKFMHEAKGPERQNCHGAFKQMCPDPNIELNNVDPAFVRYGHVSVGCLDLYRVI